MKNLLRISYVSLANSHILRDVFVDSKGLGNLLRISFVSLTNSHILRVVLANFYIIKRK